MREHMCCLTTADAVQLMDYALLSPIQTKCTANLQAVRLSSPRLSLFYRWYRGDRTCKTFKKNLDRIVYTGYSQDVDKCRDLRRLSSGRR